MYPAMDGAQLKPGMFIDMHLCGGTCSCADQHDVIATGICS